MTTQRRSGRRTRGAANQPSKPPGGRTVKFRVAGESKGKNGLEGSRFVEHRLGKEQDGSDFNPLYCLARSKNHHGQCGKMPIKGRRTCASHGGGSPARVKAGKILAPEERGKVAQIVQEVAKAISDGKNVDLPTFADHLPEFEQRMRALEEEGELLDLTKDAKILTVLRDIVMSPEAEVTLGGVVKVLPELMLAKAQILRTKQQISLKDMVPGDRFRAIAVALIEMLRKFVPESRHPEVARELRLIGAVPTETIDVSPESSR